MSKITALVLLILSLTLAWAGAGEIDDGVLQLADVFQLEYAATRRYHQMANTSCTSGTSWTS